MTGQTAVYRRYGKRVLDLSVGSAVGLISLPIQACVALLIRVRLGSPVLFRQQRPGLEGQPFTIVKFRTMTDETDAQGNLLPDEARLLPLGRFLRSTSLDELPEIWNVVRGEMSLVGPRPLLMQYLPLYSPEQSRRNEVRPGITGWAQVNGRNEPAWRYRLAMDVWYVDNITFVLDVKILCRTIWAVVSRQGISAHGQATVSDFVGD